MKMSDILDRKQREEARDPSISFIVQAPAGSGKTELLMQRFLRLLSIVEGPEQILAVTFTRKAAGEMQSRIMEALREGRRGAPPEGPHRIRTFELARMALKRDSEKGWNLLESPGRLKIQTIDSFCSSIARQMPLLSSLGRHPSVAEDADELYREAARRTILRVEDDGVTGDAVRKVMRHLDNSVGGLEERLVMMLRKRDQWLRHVGGTNGLRKFLEDSVRNLIEDTLRRAREEFPMHLAGELTASARFAASNLLNAGDAGPVTRLIGLHSLPGADAEDLPAWQGIACLLLTKEGTWRKSVNANIGFPKEEKDRKKGFQEILSALSPNDRLLSAISAIQSLPNPWYSDEEWEILDSLLRLLPAAVEEMKRVFAEEGVADFQEVSIAAIKALGTEDDPTDLMLSLDYRIQHILVDEYQDTSRTQSEMIKALTRGWEAGDGRTLFIVGDPMQSIYLFREAVVGLFLDARDRGINGIDLVPLTVSSNFRSQKNIIDWVNSSLEGAFPAAEDSLTGSISYSPFSAVHPPLDGAMVDIRLFRERDDAREAEEVVEIIKGIDRGKESVAILVRSRSHLGEVIKALKREGIGFGSEEIDPLIERPVIRDLLSLLRSLMHPYDRVAWLSILRAPWCGLALRDIHMLCLGYPDTPVWILMNDFERTGRLSEDGRARLLSIREKLKRALDLRGRVPMNSLLEGLWIELGGPACIDDASMRDAEEFFKMVGSVSSAGGIDSMGILESRMKGLYASAVKSSDAVEIMTIHRAKGLEFDHVILPGIGRFPQRRYKKMLQWIERGGDLILSPAGSKGSESAIYRYLDGIDAERERLERTRLFYVAVTRAKKRLYLLGNAKTGNDGGIKADPRSLLSSIQHVLEPGMFLDGGERPPADRPDKPLLKLKRLSASWKSPEPVKPVSLEGLEAGMASIPAEPEFDWAGEAVRHIGTVVHRYLCRMACDGLRGWDTDRVASEEGRMAAMLRQFGLSRGEAGRTAKKGAAVISRMLEDDFGRWVLEDHPEAASEAAITGMVDGKTVHAVIDRTFVDEGGMRWIIDYKAGFHEGGSVESFLESERERYREQLETYARLLAGSGETRPMRKVLYYPALGAWVEV